jgi:hypothetical protein
VAQGIPEERIGIVGMSFGAATSVIAGGEAPVRADLGGLSYADMGDAIRDYLTPGGYPRPSRREPADRPGSSPATTSAREAR